MQVLYVHETARDMCILGSFVVIGLQALGKLSAMAEEIGAANLGDLEGFARDMSEEVLQIRQVLLQ